MADTTGVQPWDYTLRKYLLLLATLVATVTYSAGFNPPGGVWQDAETATKALADAAAKALAIGAAKPLAGDPIIRDVRYVRYAVFFYCNAIAFASSLVVIVLILLLAVVHEKKSFWIRLLPLRVVMVLDLLSLMMAYAAGTCRDTFTKLYSSLLVSSLFLYLLLQMAYASFFDKDNKKHNNSVSSSGTGTGNGNSTSSCSGSGSSNDTGTGNGNSTSSGSGTGTASSTGSDSKLLNDRWRRKVLMLLATFAVSVTYVSGLNTPGGFWDNYEHDKDGRLRHSPGDPVLKEHHKARLTAFFVCNTTAFVASLLTIVLLLNRKLCEKATVLTWELYACIVVALIGLVGAYAAGSSREIATTTYVVSLVGAVLLCIGLLVTIVLRCRRSHSCSCSWQDLIPDCLKQQPIHDAREEQLKDAADKARSLVLLLATLAATITYQAGLDPPGGVWNKDGHIAGDPILLTNNPRRYKAGDPILLTNNPRRYKAFFYCNSVAFVASLVVIVLVQKKLLLRRHVLEATMILDLFGLIGAYAAGACRDVSTSIYVMALAGVVLVYVVIHVIFFTLDHQNDNGGTPKDCVLVEKRRKRLLLFAILTATITYQAGLTPPSGFLLEDSMSPNGHQHYAGDPILLFNSTKRYEAFFYCNSASFMLSMALIILLVNPNLYRPAIQSYALSVCTVAGLLGLTGAYAAGSTQHLKTSISIVVMVSVVLLILALLLLVFCVKGRKEWKISTSAVAATAPAPAPAAAAPTAAAPAAAAATPSPRGVAVAHNESSGQGRPEEEPGAQDGEQEGKRRHAKRKYLMLLGILVASVTYQAGLDQPGGVWQSGLDAGLDQPGGVWQSGHDAGDPVMHDNRKHRYHAFFYCNSTAFVASIVVIILLLPQKLYKEEEGWSLWITVMNMAVVLDLLALLGAYVTGSSRDRMTSAYVTVLIAAVLAYVAVHVALSCLCSLVRKKDAPRQQQGNGGTHGEPV